MTQLTDPGLLDQFLSVLKDKDLMLGTKDRAGLLGQATNGIGALLGAYNGLQQLGLAKDALKSQQAMAETNLANQAALTNNQLEDRQRARLGA